MITANHPSGYWIALAFDLSPVVPLVIAWFRFLGGAEPKVWSRSIPLLAVTVNMGWLLVGLFVPSTIGPS
jgi:hypothetical protein